MDTIRRNVLCWNLQEGCKYIASSPSAAAEHYADCEYTSIQCIKCLNQVQRRSFSEHRCEACQGTGPKESGEPFNVRREFQGVLHEQKFLQLCVDESTLAVEKLSILFDEFKQFIRGDLSEKDAKLSAIAAKQEEMQKEAEACARDVIGNILEMKKGVTTLVKEVQHMQNKNDNIQEHVQQLKSEVAEAKQQHNDLTHYVKEMSAKASSIEECFGQERDQSETLRKDITGIANEILLQKRRQEKMEKEARDIASNILEIKKGMTTVVKEVQHMQNKNNNIQEHVQQMNSKVADEKQQHNDLTHYVKEMSAKVSSIEQSFRQERDQSETLHKTITGIANEILLQKGRQEEMAQEARDAASSILEMKGMTPLVKEVQHLRKTQGECYDVLLNSKQGQEEHMKKVIDTVNNMRTEQEYIKSLVKDCALPPTLLQSLRGGVDVIKDCTSRHFRITRMSIFTGPRIGAGIKCVSERQILWCADGVGQYIDNWTPHTKNCLSDVFVVCGYSAMLEYGVKEKDNVRHIALYFSICRGPNDSKLRWAFDIPFTLSLLHPIDGCKDEQRKVTPPGNSPYCFTRPETARNEGYGFSNMSSLDYIKRHRFLVDDAVYFAVTLHK